MKFKSPKNWQTRLGRPRTSRMTLCLSKVVRGKFAAGVVLASFIIGLFFSAVFYPATARALGLSPALPASLVSSSSFGPPGFSADVSVVDKALAALRKAIFGVEAAERLTKQSIFDAWAIAFKTSLRYFLNTLAYDTATWLASGGEGQQPMFYTEGWGEYLTNLADGAAGTFVEKLGKNWLDNFNVCEPSNLNLKISLGLAIAETRRPRPPDCSFSEIVNNWQDVINEPDFLNRFQVIFDPTQNDIGIAAAIFNKYWEEQASAAADGIKTREEGEGWKALTEKISGAILTPGSLVRDESKTILLEEATKSEQVPTQNIVADAIDTFTQTLAGKLLQRLFKEGLASLTGSGRSDSRGFQGDLYTGQDGRSPYSGQQAAQERFLTLLDAGILTGGPYEILQQLASCPNPQKPGPEECVISQKFRLAIEQQLTVRQAIAAGYLDANAPFAFKADGFEPAYNEGYPYRSILILRTHRIVPVTWEVAAQNIRDAGNDNQTYTLNSLIAEYDNSAGDFYHLIDPDWVLKAPEHLCRVEGYGPVITSEQLTEDQRLVARATYCADYQSCIEENDDGSCRFYGYCTEEKPAWDLQGVSCPDYYDSCQSFGSASGQSVSYLKNSLDYNNCSADNAGCQWYCQEYNSVSQEWTCVNNNEQVLAACSQSGGCSVSADCNIDEGQTTCTDEVSGASLTLSDSCNPGSRYWNGTSCAVSSSCDIPSGGVSCQTTGCEGLANLLANPGFEAAAAPGELAANWTGELTYFERVSGASERIYTGSNSLRFFNVGGPLDESVNSSAPVTLAAGSYTLSGFVYNNLNNGVITVRAGGQEKSLSTSVRNRWQEVGFEFTFAGDGSTGVEINISGSVVSGTAWFDNFRISESCVTNPVKLTLNQTQTVDESKLHLDNSATECPANEAGCSQFIRTLPNLGTNLVANSSFEDWPDSVSFLAPPGWTQGDDWQAGNEIKLENNCPVGNFCLKLTSADSGQQDLKSQPVVAAKPNTSYRVSFWAKTDIEAGDNNWSARFVSGSQSDPLVVNGQTNLTLTNQWQRLIAESIVSRAGEGEFRLAFNNGAAGVIYLDGVQVEEVETQNPAVSSYKDYGTANLVNLKKAPDYLDCNGWTLNRPGPVVAGITDENQCNGETLTWGDDERCHSVDPGECADYAFQCLPDEVGCEAYTPLLGGQSIPGVVSLYDYCPLECVGYETYKQSTTYFESQEPLEYFIPKTATQCTASQAGCDEFTNLDEVAAGGEGREYYQYLRQCKKPDEPDASCQNFYAWQGSDETGFQLRVYSLDQVGGVPQYAIAEDDDSRWPEIWGQASDCDGPEDIIANPFCKEFYASDGSIRYRIEQNTISCSADCHPFRKTLLGETTVEAQANCEDSNGQWQNGACIYQAIPGQGLACSAAAAGCREYRGNAGANTYTALFANFESGTAMGWLFGEISSEALSVAGHSIKSEFYDDTFPSKRVVTAMGYLADPDFPLDLNKALICSDDQSDQLKDCSEEDKITSNCYDATLAKCIAKVRDSETCLVDINDSYCGVIDRLLAPNKTYLLSFWAKGASVTNINIQLTQQPPASQLAIANNVSLTPEWHYYTFGPFVTPTDLVSSARLRFVGDGGATDFYLDNIEIKEVQDYVYAIKNSWQTPESCDINPFTSPPTQALQFMLGCEQYRDSYSRTHNLKSFDSLCRQEAVGCEALIDTRNSTSPFAETFNVNDPVSQVNVAADNLIYLANRPEFGCSETAKGCQALGLPAINTDYQVTGYQTAYLLNNPDQYNSILCAKAEVGCSEWQTENGFSYFKDPGERTCEYRSYLDPGTNISRLGWFRTGSLAATPDCPLVDSALGISHPAAQSSEGTSGYAGLCPAQFTSCSALIDPVSANVKNELFNGSLKDLPGTGGHDGWDEAGTTLSQRVRLKANTVYTLAAKGRSPAAVEIADCPGLVSYDSSLTLTPTGELQLVLGQEADYSGRFLNQQSAECEVVISNITIIDNKVIEVAEAALRETLIDFALTDSVDKRTCNGLVDPANGCVLFNDRSSVNYKLGETDNSYLIFDSDRTQAGSIPQSDCQGACDSNAVLKVRLDRECGQWLSCSSKTQEIDKDGKIQEQCLALMACDSMNEDGTCERSALLPFAGALSINNANIDQLKNYSGFATAGVFGSATSGYLPYQSMDQIGAAANVPNGNFESVYGGTLEPVGWVVANDSEFVDKAWDRSKFSVESDINLQKQDISYLRLNSFWETESEYIDVKPGQYYLTGWINTLDLRLPAEAQIVLKQYNDNNGEISETAVRSIEFGLPWQSINESVNISLFAVRARLVLRNYINELERDHCNDDDEPPTECKLEGSSLFDDIKLKPVLDVGDTLVDRSCRVYPSSDALACEYIRDNNFYHGQFGYCLVADPQNPSVCLQWWPVDQIEGDILNEISSYADRRPLYYCSSLITEVVDGVTTPKYTVETQLDDYNIQNCTANKPWTTFITFRAGIDFPAGLAAPSYIDIIDLGSGGGSEYVFGNIRLSNNNNWQQSAVGQYGDGNINFCDSSIIITDEGIFIPEADDPADPDLGDTCIIQAGWNDLVRKFAQAKTDTDKQDYIDQVAAAGESPKYTLVYFGAQLHPTDLTVESVDIGLVDHTGNCAEDGLTVALNFNYAACQTLNQVVTPSGQNKAWAARLATGSAYGARCQLYNYITDNYEDVPCDYAADYRPFGSSVALTPDNNPALWDSRPNEGGVQPLYAEGPDRRNFEEPYQGRLGQLHFPVEDIQRLFAQSYGVWEWHDDIKQYVLNQNSGWTVPPDDDECPLTSGRPFFDWQNGPETEADICYIRPRVSLSLNSPSPTAINGVGPVTLEFTATVDSNQLPLSSYEIDWGDDTSTVVSGVSLRDRTNPENTFKMIHAYDYWQIKRDNPAACGTDSANPNQCGATIEITITDNWGKESVLVESAEIIINRGF